MAGYNANDHYKKDGYWQLNEGTHASWCEPMQERISQAKAREWCGWREPPSGRSCADGEWEKVQSDKDKHRGAAYSAKEEESQEQWLAYAKERSKHRMRSIPQTPSGSFEGFRKLPETSSSSRDEERKTLVTPSVFLTGFRK